MIKIAIISQKGGAGKTTLAINLAVEAERTNLSSLLIDLDPQSSATEWSDIREQDYPVVLSAHASRMDKLIQKAEVNNASFVFIDTAPHSENAALESAKIADLVLIPCRAGILDIKAIQSSLNICNLAQVKALVILNALPSQRTIEKEARQAIEKIGGNVCEYTVGQRIIFSHAMTAGLGVVEFDVNSKASREIQNIFELINQVKKDAK
ncbi:ParA family protein [Candidatus Megaera venefica]|jgi:chromosome partitioning protein|uniref:ParA family protein n=1 Tax=Candidatus Megaera venefica TaxID=2055910 RepID=A0ABU5NDE6_9RICK|nr:AAA family ATPase [Candidatus Megaera venefica]MEA0971183.1 ParA family protein [Candidatus Megaera venefica]